MPTFSYKAIGPSGQPVTGTLEAPDRRHVVLKLAEQNIKPIAITAGDSSVETEETDESIDFFKSSRRKKSAFRLRFLSSQSKVGLNFLRKLLELLSSGMPPGDAVKLLSLRLTDPQLKELADNLWKDLSEGRSLAASMASTHGAFSESAIHLVEAGEASGNLTPILEKIIDQMEETNELRSRILNSLAYPAFICVVAFGVVTFFLAFLLPKIRNMITTLGGEMQFFAKALIVTSDIALKFGPAAIAIALIAAVALIQWRKTPKGRKVTDYWKLRLPFVGKIFLYAEIFQTSSLMATLMDSGVNTTETMRLCHKTIQNTQMQAKFNICRRHIQEGMSMAGAFQRTHFMPDLAIDILTVGENTGNIVRGFREITKIYRRELTHSLHVLTATVSSGALLFAFVLVTLIALSIILSILQISHTLSI